MYKRIKRAIEGRGGVPQSEGTNQQMDSDGLGGGFFSASTTQARKSR